MTSSFAVPRICAVLPLLTFSLAAQETRKRDPALERALLDLDALNTTRTPQQSPRLAAPTNQSSFKLLDLSLDGLFAVGTSTERDRSLERLQAGGHDPRKRGFTVQNVELSAAAAVDPYFDAEAHLVYFLEPLSGETTVELEEAFAVTRQLGSGFQLKGGTFFTEFGRHNPQHPHAWDWVDAPVIHTRVFGPDGMRGPGVRASWLAPVAWFSELYLGVQNSNGETMASFGSSELLFAERAIGGRFFEEREVRTFKDLAWHARSDNNFELSEETTLNVGISGALGPNPTGDRGRTLVSGADLMLKWRAKDHFRGWPFFQWTTEVLRRDYRTGEQVDANDPTIVGDEVTLPASTLRDWGGYSQALWGCCYGWALGLRLEHASGRGRSYDQAAHAFAAPGDDALRNDRFRCAPLVVWHPTEFSRLRCQYNYDHAAHLHGGEAHSFWVCFEFMIGAHPAHKY